MIKYLIKQSCRACMVQFKNYWGIILVLAAIAAFGCIPLITQLYRSAFAPQEWIFEFALGCAALCLLLLLFGKRPTFFIHPATLHFFSSTPAFGRIKAFVLIRKAAGVLFVTGIIGLIICSFWLTAFFFDFLICFTLYFLSIHLIRWLKYNGTKPMIWILVYTGCTICFLLSAFDSRWYFVVLQALIAVLFIICYFRIPIDMSRYYEDSLYIERMNHASRHKDMAVMQQITADHVADKRHHFMLNDLKVNKNNILFCKALIETLRMSKQVWVILFSLPVLAIIINATSLFSAVPLIGQPNIAKVIGTFFLSIFLVNLKEMYLKRYLSMIAKQQEGLFLPYKKTKIAASYSLICTIAAILAVIAAGIALQAAPVSDILSVALLLIGMNLSFWFEKKEWITMASNLIIFAAAYCIF